MGTFTGEIIATIHGTGRGSDYFGACEVCGKHCSETFVHAKHHIYVRQDGTRYLSSAGGRFHGHSACLISQYGSAIDKTTLGRVGRLTLAPV
jgi:hypothetical protein